MLTKHHRYIVWLITGWLIVSSLACSVDMGIAPTPPPTVTPQPTKGEPSSDSKEEATTVPSGSQRANLTVVNNTDTEMCYVYISLSTNENWGPDRLGEDEKIPVGGTHTFSLDPGTWDIRIEDCGENVLLEQGDVVITGSHTLTVSDSSSSSGGTCGDGTCSTGENASNCPSDCGTCGDGLCTTFENGGNCPQDCSSATCGNGVCESSEDVYSCADDCGTCGDGLCTVYENPGNCPQDCGSGGTCGNGSCEPGEDVYSCADDCGICGDGLCTVFENSGNCPQDCGSGSGTCGNGTCESGEDVNNCDVDCGFCGDGLCTTFENGGNCPSDCQ